MLWATIVLILLCVICNAQGSDNCAEEDCYRGDKCIGQYIDLEIYVLNNKTLTEKLAQTFFNTGRAASKFVKITYNLQTSSNIQDNIINCSSQQSTYIWSEAALYLLGPKAMYWFTLFAVNIYEIDVTIELPCLCNDVYNSLLSRLTYLIKVYAATKYHDKPLQFVNKYYFNIKSTTNNSNYKTVIIIIAFITVLPLTLIYAIGPLTVIHVYPIVYGLITRQKFKENSIDYVDSGIAQQVTEKKNYFKKLAHLTPLLFTSIGICIGFLVFHVYSVIRFIQYGDEVLSSYDNRSHPLPITHAAISSTVVGGGLVLSVTILVIRISKSKKQDSEVADSPSSVEAGTGSTQQTSTQQTNTQQTNTQWPAMLTAAMISVNITYIGCYFTPYMLLAFIHDPLLTTFTYITILLFTCCVYLIFLGAWSLYKFCKGDDINTIEHTKCENITADNITDDKDQGNSRLAKLFDTLLYSYMVWAVASSVIIFLFVIIYIITLGSFDDFEELKNLTPSLLIAVLGVFLLKPALKLAKKTFNNKPNNDDNNDDKKKTKEKTGQEREEQNNDDETPLIQEMKS